LGPTPKLTCGENASCDHVLGVWAVVPARGGSIGIPRKNLISCAGKPLIQHVIETAKQLLCPGRIVVITDSPEIAEFAQLHLVQVILEEARSGPDETLDQKIHRNVANLQALGAVNSDVVLTLQPTSPLTSASSIRSAIEQIDIGNASVITVANDPHLRWGVNRDGTPIPHFEERKNRQELPPDYRETGGIIAVRLGDLASTGSRIVSPVGLVVVEEREAIDIDSFGHLYEAQHWLTRGKILFRVEANQSLGMGHLYRCLAVAYELSRHEILFLASDSSPLVEQVVSQTPFNIVLFSDKSGAASEIQTFEPDLIFIDFLDTDVETISEIRESRPSARIVTFENEGSGAHLCDLGVYDLTKPPKHPPLQVIVGPEKAILGPPFELFRSLAESNQRPQQLLLTFGGTDPSGLTEKVLNALGSIRFTGQVTVVLGLGSRDPDVGRPSFAIEIHRNVTNMALLMGRHQLAISSMGRTIFELAAAGVPTLAFSQNPKEERHVHVGKVTGSVFGGSGYKISPIQMAAVIQEFISDDKGNQMRISEAEVYRASRSNSKVVGEILMKAGLSHFALR
jgi:CMP-N-acetylneuraminic acid synthetase/spore coat polysaccharide biosynthesis predicted glycosyltransferase SpsG